MNSERWYDDVTDRTVEGRFIDTEIADPVNSTPYKEATKFVTAIEIRPRALTAGPAGSTAQLVKPDNRDELIRRFPAAWAAYEAMKAGRPIPRETHTPLNRGEVLGLPQIQALLAKGYGSEERFLAMTDSEVLAVLGQKGIRFRDTYRAEVERIAATPTLQRQLPPPPSTPITIEGPITDYIYMILKSRSVELYEEIAGWTEERSFRVLGGDGPKVKQFAREKLMQLAAASKNPPVPDASGKGIIAHHETRQKVDDSGAKGPRPKKETKSKGQSSFGTPIIGGKIG